MEKKEIPVGKLAYFRERLKNRLHELVFLEFLRQQRERKLTQAELARRIGKAPEQVNRWLGAPGNWELDTVSDLLLGMGAEPAFSIEHLADRLSPVLQKAAQPTGQEEIKENSAAVTYIMNVASGGGVYCGVADPFQAILKDRMAGSWQSAAAPKGALFEAVKPSTQCVGAHP